MFATLANLPTPDNFEGIHTQMAAKTKSSSKAKDNKAETKAAPASRADQVRSAAERVVDLPVGAVLEVGDRVTDLVEPFSGRGAAEKQLKSYGTQLRRTVKRTERRGASARRKATTEVRKTRSKVERAARKRQRTVETTLRRNRDEVEQRVRRVADQFASIR
jgi:hypothetical protein